MVSGFVASIPGSQGLSPYFQSSIVVLTVYVDLMMEKLFLTLPE